VTGTWLITQITISAEQLNYAPTDMLRNRMG